MAYLTQLDRKKREIDEVKGEQLIIYKDGILYEMKCPDSMITLKNI